MSQNAEGMDTIDLLFESNKEFIRRAYQGDGGPGKTLNQIKVILERDRGFPSLSLSAYEIKLRELGLRKKVRRNEWLPIWQHCQHIKAQGSEPAVYLNGTLLRWDKVWKEIRRNKAQRGPPVSSQQLPTLPSDIHVTKSDHAINTREVMRLQSPLPLPLFLNVSSFTMMPAIGDVADTIMDLRLASTVLQPRSRESLLVNLPWLECISFMQSQFTTHGISTRQAADASLEWTNSHRTPSTLSHLKFNLLCLNDVDPAIFRAHNETLKSKTALAIEFDAVYFLAKAVLRLSNRLINLWRPSLEDLLLYRITMSRISPPILKAFLKSDLPSMSAAQKAFVTLSAWQKEANTWRFLLLANDGHLLGRLKSTRRLIFEASRLVQRDILEVCLAELARLSGLDTVKHLKDIYLEIPWGPDIKMYESVRLYFLDHGLDVDSPLPEYIHDALFRNHASAEIPMDWRLSLLDKEYYEHGQSGPYTTMRQYSRQKNPPFRRGALCLAARRGPESLSLHLRQWRDGAWRHGLSGFLELVLAEQFHLPGHTFDWHVIKSLLEYGVDPQLPSIKGITSIQDLLYGTVHNLSRSGITQPGLAVMERLNFSGARFDASAIELAVSDHGVEVLEALQRIGADMQLLGGQALAVALRCGNSEAVDWLLQAGSELQAEIPDSGGMTVLGAAIEDGPCAPTRGWRVGSSPLSILRGLDLIINLIATGTCPLPKLRVGDSNSDRFISDFISSLCYLRSSITGDGRIRAVQRLFEAGVVPGNKSSLLEALAEDDVHLCTHLLGLVNVLGSGSPLAVLIATEAPATLIREAMQLTPNLDACVASAKSSFHGWNPIQAAAHSWNLDCLKELVSKGATFYEADSGSIEMPLLAYACEAKTLSAAEAQAQMAMVLYLLDLGCALDNPSPSDVLWRNGMSPLQMACRNGNLELSLLLLERGADPNRVWLQRIESVKTFPWTCLDLAASAGCLDTVQVLLNAGGISGGVGETPYNGAIDRALGRDFLEIAKLICRYAASKGLVLREKDIGLLG
ncbi:ankyrin repeat domain-containing protein 50 [Microdochium nivale]|nr:ankyrin repeat domain-containing protein 50 [Microdochium nivale]